MSYSIDFREKAMSTKERLGLTVREVAERFGVHFNTVQNWSKRQEAKPIGRKAGVGLKLDRTQLAQHVQQFPDAYIAERAAHFGVGRHTVWHALQGLKLGRKKNLGTPEDEYTE